MSVQAIAWALGQETGGPGPKSVLLCLANYADEAGTCFPGQDRIARETEQSVRTVRSVLQQLERLGLIRRQSRGRPGGGRTSDRYYLNLGNAADFAGKGKPANDEGQTGNSEQANRQRVADEPSVEPSVEPSESNASPNGDAASKINEEEINRDASTDGGLFAVARSLKPGKKPGKDPVNVAAKELADRWHDLNNGMVNFLAARGVLVKALRAGRSGVEIAAALDRLHAANVPLTAASLHTELRGGIGSGRPGGSGDQSWKYDEKKSWGTRWVDRAGPQPSVDGWADE